MKLALRLALVAIACALIVLAAGVFDDPGEAASLQPPVRPASTDRAPLADHDARTDEPLRDFVASTPDESVPEFGLTVVDERANPVARAFVAVRDARGEVQHGQSEDDGRVSLARRDGHCEVFVLAEGYEIAREHRTFDVGESAITLHAASARVAGVLTVDGAPPGEELTLELERTELQLDELELPMVLRDEFRRHAKRRGVADARGYFAFDAVRSDWRGDLIAPSGYCERRAQRRGFGSRRFELAHPRSDLRIDLERLPRLVGRVVAPDGSPAPAGAPIVAWIQWPDSGGTGTSGELADDGRFQFVLREASVREAKLTVECDAGNVVVVKRDDELTRLPNGDLDFGVLRLATRHGLRVRVVGAQGEPVADARARVVGERTWSSLDASGRGEIATSATGAARVRVAAKGHWASEVDVLLPEDEVVEVVLAPANRLTVQVLDASGAPVSDVLVRLQSVGVKLFPESNAWWPDDSMIGVLEGVPMGGGQDTQPSERGWNDNRPNEQGRVVVQGLATECEIEVLVLDGMQIELATRRLARMGAAEQRVVDFVLDAPLRTLSGRVVDDDGRALSGVQVAASCEGGLDSVSETTGEDGRFELRGLSSRRARLETSRPEFVRAPTLDVDLARAARDLEIVLHRGRSLTVEVVDPIGRPVVDGVVFASNPRWQGLWRPHSSRGGQHEFTLLPTDALTLSLDLHLQRLTQEIGPLEEQVRIVAPQPGSLSVRIADTVSFDGRQTFLVVRGDDELQPLRRQVSEDARSDALAIGPLSPGEYEVALFTLGAESQPTMIGAPRSVTIESARTATLVLP